MIGFGAYFAKNAPRHINGVFGYRTPRSTKNLDTWIFAHNHCGRLWRVIGWVMLPLSAAAMLFVINKDADFVGLFVGILALAQCLVMVLSVIPTEIALRRNFDKNGNRYHIS